MTNLSSNNIHMKGILNNIPKENFQLVQIFHKGLNDVHSNRAFSNGVVVVKNNKLAGRLEDIKFLESLEPESRKQFLREGKILSAMNHKNIPQVYDILEYEDRLLFRYEHVEGYSLREVLNYFKRKKLLFPKHVATSITLKMLNALYYAHNEVKYEGQKKSIIHCDIKPSNIILCAKDYTRKTDLDEKFISLLIQNKVEPFLIDFGIAKFRGESTTDGTTNYLSPAQILKRKLDWRTDTHQALLVYYEMLTTHTPYFGLSRTKILEEKLKRDFTFDTQKNINGMIRDFIEKGTKRETSVSFKSEKDCIRSLSNIESRQKRFDFFRRYKKPILTTTIIVLCLVATFFTYKIWDYNTQSIDALIQNIKDNSNLTIEELEAATTKIQTRAFEKKYYEPLIKGEFRDIKTGKPLYPSHLDIAGNWILVGPETESAGIFVGLLFEYSNRYPKLLNYAKEYAEPVLVSEFDGTAGKRYMYALIPGYEKTHDERYLQKLINISNILIDQFSAQEGSTQCDDLYYGKLFLYVYNKTGQPKYLNFYTHYTKTFIRNNIDKDGYIYEYASVNATSTYGPLDDDKMGILVTPIESTDSNPIGSYFMLSSSNKAIFKDVTSPFSKDFIEVLIELHSMYILTNNTIYDDAYKQSLNYYLNKLSKDSFDYLFISNLNEKNRIPKDTVSTLKSLQIFKDTNETLYRDKLYSLLTSNQFRDENENGLLSGNVLIDTIVYVHSDETKKNQTLIESDALFLELS
jgi:eukaryotic-like serine/threonine-protein kinase